MIRFKSAAVAPVQQLGNIGGKILLIDKLTEEQRKKKRWENEKKKEYLRGYRNAKRKADRLDAQIQELRLNEMCPSVKQSDMPSAHNITDLSDYMVKMDKLFTQYIKAKNETRERMEEICECIEQLDDEVEKQVLVYRYINNAKWEQIACMIGYEWAQVHRIHSDALEHLKIGE